MKKYKLKLELNSCGEVVVEADSSREARDKGERMLTETTPSWFEWGSQSVEVGKFDEENHECEFEWGTGKCICGKVDERIKHEI